MKPYGCIAPGQNAQYVGMGSDLYNSSNEVIRAKTRKLFRTASEILGYDLTDVCFNGPMERLSQTIYTQPALATHSTICFEVLKVLYEERTGTEFDFAVSAGASLGEYPALMMAGVMGFKDMLGLVQKRAEAMDKVIKTPGYDAGKQVCLNIDARSIDEICAKFGVEQSNCNYGEQTVVGGTREAIQQMMEYLEEKIPLPGKRRMCVIPMNTEAAFHTSLMSSARRAFAPFISTYRFNPPNRYVLSNCTGNFYAEDGSDMVINLIHQIDNPVRWIYEMRVMVTKLLEVAKGGTIRIFEFGGGKPNISDPTNQRSNFGGITTRILKGMEIKPEQVELHECISEETINSTLDVLVPRV